MLKVSKHGVILGDALLENFLQILYEAPSCVMGCFNIILL